MNRRRKNDVKIKWNRSFIKSVISDQFKFFELREVGEECVN